MKNLLSLLLVLATSTLFSQDITGPWSGLLKVPGMELRMVLNISKEAAGYSATMDSPDQGAKGIPVQTITFENNNLVFTIPQAGIEYKGILENNGFKGTFSQNGSGIPLDLSRGEIKRNRPQTPVKPYPYHEEEVTFRNDKAGVTLAGTLTMPKKEGNFPAVILITGSSPQNRDEEILEHKPFLVLADHLTRNGYAVLRYDDRGVGASTGEFDKATTIDFATDTEAAFNYLKTRKEINKKKIGLLGHSEGGMIAPLTAAKNTDVAFIIMLAGPGIPGTEQMILQNYMLGKSNGMPEEDLAKLSKITRGLYDIAIAENDVKLRQIALLDYLNKEMRPFFASKGIPEEDIKVNLEMQAHEIASPWYVGFLKYDPSVVIDKVKCPILALNGDKDIQVAAAPNLEGIKRTAEKGGNKKVTVKSFAGLNHLFQECKSCTISEYGEIEQTVSPEVLTEIKNWMEKNVK